MDTQFSAVYGPVQSWRWGRSLGIDPIGAVSTCSFNCVYCQLGEIQVRTAQRRVFVPAEQIWADLAALPAETSWDVMTLSGSGEPTLALNLEAILTGLRQRSSTPIVVLTNSTLLGDAEVQRALTFADVVAVKLDAATPEQWQRIDRPVADLNFETFLAGLRQFRPVFTGHLAVQTMVLQPWPDSWRVAYSEILRQLRPDEVQFNTPTRPRPQEYQLAARGNSPLAEGVACAPPIKCVSTAVLAELGMWVQQQVGVKVRYR